jgi:hypothetical protein
MERDFYNDEFEELIRQKTDQYKMYPSDKVWKEVYNSLHTRRRRFIVGMSFLITGILFIAGKELLMPGTHTITAKKTTDTISSPVKTDISPSAPVFSELKVAANSRQVFDDENKSTSTQPVVSPDPGVQQDMIIPIAPVSGAEKDINGVSGTANPPIARESSDNLIETFAENTPGLSKPVAHSSTQALAVVEEIKTISPGSLVSKENTEDKNDINWLQQYATYELKNTVKRGRFNWQVYFSPTVNYRSLSGGDVYTVPKTGVQYVPIALTHYGSPDDYVNHKPAIGFEAGGSMLYRLTRTLTLKTGLQFNYSRYSIKAYSSSSSQQATIALNSFTGYGYTNNTITALSNVQNFGGNMQKDLYNRYYQLSVPVGFELRILGNKRLQLNVAANVQPTYLLNRNSYVLTTDYSDYTKAPSLFRRWNFNGAVEAFVSYKIGGLRWQIGPQFRYQLLSTYTDQYPIKENLKEYGIKIGVSKTIW